jgi:hypothetical protein
MRHAVIARPRNEAVAGSKKEIDRHLRALRRVDQLDKLVT